MDTESQPQRNRSSLLNQLIAAIRFLSIIPMPGASSASSRTLAEAIPVFPVVGALIGALLVLVGLAAGWLWNDSVRAVAVVLAWGMLTAGLHLDGLSDTFDGVMSWRPREQKLEIMHDSRIGVMGALALAAILGLKMVLLASAGAGLSTLIVAPALGRWAMCYGLCRCPSARADGLGAAVQAQSTPAAMRGATIIAAVMALAIAGLRGAVALALVWLAARALAQWWVRDLGGLTGDTYGALCEITEVVALAALTARL